jgi:DNA-binding CsgD family transcriptional regulator
MTFDWEKHRGEICVLYLRQGKTMKQIAAIMEEKYGFKPW